MKKTVDSETESIVVGREVRDRRSDGRDRWRREKTREVIWGCNKVTEFIVNSHA